MGPWLIKAINVLLLGASCYLVADVVTEIGGEALEPTTVPNEQVRYDDPAAGPSASPAAILDRNLFGAQLAGDAQIDDEDEDEVGPLTATKLPLRLLGTAAASNEDRSRAAIQDEKNREHIVVAVGDQLEKHRRVSVKAIERTRVILSNAGKLEELALHEDEAGPKRPVKKRAARQARRKPAKKPTLNDRLSKLNGDDGQGISRILSSARIVPDYADDGSMRGMKVDAIKDDSIFQKVGLENGDIITEVNGIVIDRLEATSAIFDEFASADDISVAATRGGETVLFNASAPDLLE